MWASLILWKSQGYSLEVNGLKQEKPTVTAVTLQLKDHARDVTHALAYHPTMRCKSSKTMCSIEGENVLRWNRFGA